MTNNRSFAKSARTVTSVSNQIRRLGVPEYFWEDVGVGDVITGAGITVTDAHLVTWAGLTGDIVSLHLDEEYASSTQFGTRIAHGPFTLALALGMLTRTGCFSNVVAWLGLDEVRALAPVVPGDTVHPEAELVVARETSKPGQGVWTLAYRVLDQNGNVVMTFRSSFLVRRRDG